VFGVGKDKEKKPDDPRKPGGTPRREQNSPREQR
jgi:hypothetical protein